MKKLALNELQNIEYEMLCVIADFCEKNNIRYGLAGGTALGAVRHGGFIPWDDDIDLEMPRPDYNRFLELADRLPERYKVSSPYNDDNNFRPYAKVLDLNTKLIEFPDGKNIETHVYLDIFPIDGMPDEPVSQEKHRKTCMRWMLLFYGFRVARYKVNETKGIVKGIWKTADLIQRKFIKNSIIDIVDKKCNLYDFDSSKYCSEVIAGYGFKDTMPALVYDFSGKIKFRDREFNTFKFPEYYLINIYGKYWELPPEDKRIKHDCIAYLVKEND